MTENKNRKSKLKYLVIAFFIALVAAWLGYEAIKTIKSTYLQPLII